MKPTVLVAVIASLALIGCAKFSTKQIDRSYSPETGGTNGHPTREIVTKAGAWTFFSAKSSLATWKATQTDKTQGAQVGGLVQEGGQTNQVNDIVGAVVSAAIKAAAKP